MSLVIFRRIPDYVTVVGLEAVVFFCEDECRTWFNSKVAGVATAMCSPDMQSSGLYDAYPALTVHSASSGYLVISAVPVAIINFHSTVS